MRMSKGKQCKDGADKCDRMGRDVSGVAAAAERGKRREFLRNRGLYKQAQENILFRSYVRRLGPEHILVSLHHNQGRKATPHTGT